MNKTKLEIFELAVFSVLILLWLIPIWTVEYFVTGDGPCHLYNSRIILDYWLNRNEDFYDPFYYLNTAFEPNWLFYLMTIPVMSLFGPIAAEKFVFTAYVILFGFGFRFLISSINPASKFLSVVGLLFCYHKLIMMGFVNNSLSLALWFWVAAFWWRKRNNFELLWVFMLSVLIMTVYSAHPMGLYYFALMVGCMIAGLFFYELKTMSVNQAMKLLYKRAVSVLIAALPVLVLFLEFLQRHTWSSNTTNLKVGNLFKQIFSLSPLSVIDQKEEGWVWMVSGLCILLFITAIVLRLRQKKWLPQDGLLLFIGVVFLTIFFSMNTLTGGLEITLRMAVIPFFAFLFWSAIVNFPLWSQVVTLIISLLIAGGLLSIRMEGHHQASELASEINSCKPHISDRSTLLVLNYDWAGLTPDSQIIANKIWLLPHVDCYLGTDKPLIISDNYEAHFSYFPVQKRWQTNMYVQTDKEGINFDHRPPRADMLSFHRRTGHELNYVLMLSYRDEFKDHPYTQEIFSQLNEGYNKIYTSEQGRCVLYQSK